MKLTVENYLKAIKDEQVVVEKVDKTAAQAQQKTTLTTAIKTVIGQLTAGQVGQYVINVKMKKGDPVSLRFESNLINVPLDEAERLDPKMLDQGPEYPVNLYMVIESPDVNKSGLRIDELANETDQAGSVKSLVEKAQEWVASHLAAVMEVRTE